MPSELKSLFNNGSDEILSFFHYGLTTILILVALIRIICIISDFLLFIYLLFLLSVISQCYLSKIQSKRRKLCKEFERDAIQETITPAVVTEYDHL